MNKVNHSALVFLSMLILVVSACSSTPKNVELLDQARFEYNEIAKNERVVEDAPEAMARARDSLEEAELRWDRKEEQWRIEHVAYLVRQQVETAKLIASTAQTEREIVRLTHEKSQLTQSMREAQIVEARQQTSDIERQMSGLQTEQTERGMVLTLGDTMFETGEATLAPGAARNIAKIAAFMRNYPERRAVIEGHTDSEGDPRYNLRFSQERALTVRSALIHTGIPSSSITIKGFGDTRPIASNTTDAGRQSNRRIDIVIPHTGTQVTEFDDD